MTRPALAGKRAGYADGGSAPPGLSGDPKYRPEHPDGQRRETQDEAHQGSIADPSGDAVVVVPIQVGDEA